MRVESWPAHLIEAEHIGLGCAVGIDSNTIVDKIRNLKGRANRARCCAGLETTARLGPDIDRDGELLMWGTIDWMSRFLAVRWSKRQRPLPVSHAA